MILTSALLPSTVAAGEKNIPKGYDKGVSWKPVIPTEKVTFVKYDEDSYLDDYAYLAAIPTAVFNNGDNLYSHPLLFFEDEIELKEDKEITINARLGIDYFMDDWKEYCLSKFDKITAINVPENDLDSKWRAKQIKIIENDNPFDIAS